jgi:hypothetical protein
MAGAPYLIDSNILIRWVQPIDPDFGIVESALETWPGKARFFATLPKI